jgi:uncharacterized protein YciI
MYIVLLKFIKPLDVVDLALPDHVDWVTKQYDAGCFLVSGRQVPPDEGAVIIARNMPRGRLDALLATDPWIVQRLAKYEVIEFRATRTAPELAKFNEAILT